MSHETTSTETVHYMSSPQEPWCPKARGYYLHTFNPFEATCLDCLNNALLVIEEARKSKGPADAAKEASRG